ncbi:MAG: DegQ family serine endoprotease [Thermodesulfovibrionales bacterium]|nr:DegQ family serine endoprotease [Thermodesulfovibrionales bacterium]
MAERKRFFPFGILFILIGLIVGLGIASQLNFIAEGTAKEDTITPSSVEYLSKTNQAMAEIVAAVKPSVVNISSTSKVKGSMKQSPFPDDPLFRRFFGDRFSSPDKPREFKRSGLGSGVIFDKRGYILTNNHVVKGADEIKVKLSDNREFKGEVIGSDPKTDLAVVKIDTDNLPVIQLGDSDALKPGETVLAIGNPFGLNQTITSGIVSATGRANVGIADYEDFIQTDAAINPGNSGGALVNIKGELVGINTAIFSTTGGYQGIGFAIPSNMAKSIMESLIKNGKVVRGWLGIYIQPLTPELAKQFGISDEKGVLVGDVIEDSPAEKSGIQRGDVILELNGKKVEDPRSLRNMVAGIDPNDEVTLKLVREGQPTTVRVKITELSDEQQRLSGNFKNQLSGVHVQQVTPDIKKNLDIPQRVSGVIVTDIEDDSPADGILMKDDILMEINRKQVKGIKEYEVVMSKLKAEENILILIFRHGSAFYVTLPAK